MVQIDISTMPAGVHEVELHPLPADLDLSDDDFEHIKTKVRLDVGDQQVLVRLEVSAIANLICDRTLVPFKQPVRGDFTIIFSKKSIEAHDADETVKRFDPSMRELDITDEVRDTLLLSVPLRKVAPEATETELVLIYGGQSGGSSIDPRWEALTKLKSGEMR